MELVKITKEGEIIDFKFVEIKCLLNICPELIPLIDPNLKLEGNQIRIKLIKGKRDKYSFSYYIHFLKSDLYFTHNYESGKREIAQILSDKEEQVLYYVSQESSVEVENGIVLYTLNWSLSTE